MPKPSTKSFIPPISWDADQQALTWALLNELEKQENFKVLFGKRDPKEVSWSVNYSCLGLSLTEFIAFLEHLW